MKCHFPAIGLIHDDNKITSQVDLIGLNPPEEVTSEEYLNIGEERSGLGMWKRDLYGVGPALAGKRAKRGWHSGMEKELFAMTDLQPVVKELICWNGGISGNEWFAKMKELPWYNAE